MELGSLSELDYFDYGCNSWGRVVVVGGVLATFKRTSCGVHKLLRNGEAPTTLTSVVLVVASSRYIYTSKNIEDALKYSADE